MSKPAMRISIRHARQDDCDGTVKGAAGACFSAAQSRLDLRPTRLDERQIRRVGGQIQQPDPTPGQHLLDAPRFVHSQIVQHDAVPWSRITKTLEVAG
jgi:hypothetical protein